VSISNIERLLIKSVPFYRLSEYVEPIMIVIQTEELWHYRYPELQSQVPIEILFVSLSLTLATTISILPFHVWCYILFPDYLYQGSIILIAPLVFFVFGSRRQYKNIREVSQAVLALTLGISLTGLITNTLKVFVGKLIRICARV